MDKKLAIVFPGQGSQSLGMASEIVQEFPEIKELFTEACDVLGYDLWTLIKDGPEADLNQTENTQPAMLVTAYACWKAWIASGGSKPELIAGHSLGEYTALVAAGALKFADAVKLVSMRGKFMEEAVAENKGSMAAIIGLDDGRIEEICVEASNEPDIVSPANYNSIGQVVIAGSFLAVEKAIALANDAGAKLAKILPVSVPCHCPLMRPAAEQLKEALSNIEIFDLEIPVVRNIDTQTYQDAKSIKEGLVEQLYSPVRWVETILKMRESNINKIIECGPGKVLVGLTKRIDKSLGLSCIHNKKTINAALN